MNPLNFDSYEFLANFKGYISHFGDLIEFQPVFRFENRLREAASHRQKTALPRLLAPYCYGFGNFCSQGKINGIVLSKPVKVVDQGIKQSCLFDYDLEKFLEFVPLYKDGCLAGIKNRNFELDYCGDQIMEKILGKENFSEKIMKCYEESFQMNKSKMKFKSSNSVLSKNAQLFSPTSKMVIPSFLIEDYAIKVKNQNLNL
jgi:hypothetical protein